MKHAINASKMKEDNQRLILDCIRRHPISRADLSVLIHLTRPSITMIVDSLLNDGLLVEEPFKSNKVGRHPILLKIKGDSRYIAAVNIKRNTVEVGIVTLGGDILTREVFENEGCKPDDMLLKTARTIKSMVENFVADQSAVLGIGVCTPGPLDYKKGVILNPPNFNAWHNVPVAEKLHMFTGFEVKLENISNTVALEEKYFGKARNISSFMTLLVEGGIGSGIIVRDRLYRGSSGRAREIGHTSICFNGPLCVCGNRGCLEKYAATAEILKNTKYGSWKELMDSFISSGEGAEILEKEAEYLSAVVVSAFNLLDIECVILLGEVSYHGEIICKKINDLVCSRVISNSESCSLEVVCSDNPCGVRTAAMPLIDSFYKG